MKKHVLTRLLSLVLAFAMVAAFAVPVEAASGISWEEVPGSAISQGPDREVVEPVQEEAPYKDTDVVRVSIVLEEKSTVAAGYSTQGIGQNPQALGYRQSLQARQEAMAQTISSKALGGAELDVVWNMTLVANIISANVPYGSLDAIRAIDGVADVFPEQRYEPAVAEVGGQVAEPQTATSSGMTGASSLWALGYTGAGTRIAIIDTGTDTDHEAFDGEAFLYALAQDAQAAGVAYDEYVASLDLLDQAEIAQVLPQLNVHARNPKLTAKDLYLNEKLAFGYNYVDRDLDLTHDHDTASGHGSHVAGIATANRYVNNGDGTFSATNESTFVNGAAPDAQLLTMKVFGKNGGAYDSDYMAAIEDAILLGCDAVNLSLGSSNAGNAYSEEKYAQLLDSLTETDTVVVMSAGNSGYWAEEAYSGGYLYNTDVNLDTVGSPGSFTNSLAVASVDNIGSTGSYFQVGELTVFYTETSGYNNAPMATLDVSADGSGTTLPYVFVDGVGVESDYEGIDLAGKVVFCSRGTTSFFEKANVAAAQGAAAIVVYNNQPGTISMNLEGYQYTAPCVSILQSEGAAIRAASTEATTGEGVTYYTGELTNFSKVGISVVRPDYYTMSSFSSWGVPGDLSMKPEITAPGGSIYSVNGETADTNQYVLMSGTSMAAPQVTGLSALMAQYIQANGLEEKTGLSVRALSQSLLMSTAEPLFEEASGGNYYSILTQGAGLARGDLATSAESYVLVDGQTDGKVKAELGDDPDRTGSYSFSFTLNNLTDEALDYGLSADFFTQDVFQHGQALYLDTWITNLAADVSFTAGGTAVVAGEDLADFDLNGDGQVDAADADFLLEYLLGNEEELKGQGDVNGDGQVNTYDAHVLLVLAQGKSCVTVPAGGSVEVTVNVTLPESVKEYLDLANPNGAYIEGFVYAAPVASEEGTQGVTHSIPVLAFYGGWTDASMFDLGSPVEYSHGLEARPNYLGLENNFIGVQYAGDSNEYYFGGNPLGADDEYLPQRNALNNQNGDTLTKLYFGLIRNAGDARIVISNTGSGEVYLDQELGEVSAAFYYTNGGRWMDTQKSLRLNWQGTDGKGEKLAEGETVTISFMAAPEYYRGEDGSYNWEELGEGAYLTNQVTIDNTAPELLDVSMSLMGSKSLTVKTRDNQYVAAVVLYNQAGTKVYSYSLPNQTEAGAESSVGLSLEGASGSKFLVAVYDYAMNETVYALDLGADLGGDSNRPYFTAIDRTNITQDLQMFWVGFGPEEDGEIQRLGNLHVDLPRAAEYVEGYVFEISNDNQLLVASDEDLGTFTYLSTLEAPGHDIVGFNDLAYNYADGKLYGLFYSRANDMNTPYLCTIDMLMGTMDVLGEMAIDANNLAIDDAGNFYSTVYGDSSLYTYTAGTYTAPTYVGDARYSTKVLNTMAWDHNTGKLYWAYANSGTYLLLELNPETAEPTVVRTLNANMVGLYIRPQKTAGIFDPTDEIRDMVMNPDSATVVVGGTKQLSVTLWPWTVSDKSLTWTSSDPAIATVNAGGLVTGVSEGVATITATSVLDPDWSVSCQVTVQLFSHQLNGVVWDENGEVWWSEFDTSKLPAYTKLTESPLSTRLTSVAYGSDGKLYAASMDTDSFLSNYYTVNPETLEATQIGGSTQLAYMDLAYAPHLTEGGCMLAVFDGYVVMIDSTTGEYMGAWDWCSNSLVGIAYYGSGFNTNYQEYYDMFLLVDMDGNVYLEAFIDLNGEYHYFQGEEEGYLENFGYAVDTPYFSSLYFDGAFLYWSAFNEASNDVKLMVWDCEDTGEIFQAGAFADGTWPVGGLFQLGVNPVAGQAAGNRTQSVRSTAVKAAASTDPLETPERKGEQDAKGTLNAAPVSAPKAHPVAEPMSASTYDEATGTVTVALTAVEETTNGRLTLAYDTEKLTFVSLASTLDASADVDTQGSVEFAYAAAKAVAQGDTLALVTFQVAEGAADGAEIKVQYAELNNGASDVTETLTVELPHTCYAKAFVDVDLTRWYHEAIDFVVGAGLMKGMSEDTFAPNGNMTRGQLVTVLYRLAGSPETEATVPFTDVASGRFYTKAVAWAYETGIAKGMTETLFVPEGSVTREQMVTFFARYAAFAGQSLETQGDLMDFVDADKVSGYAVESMTWAVENGIIKGMTPTTLEPKGTATRAQVAEILMRLSALLGE